MPVGANGTRVLVVDDEARFAEVVVQFMLSSGYVAEGVLSARAALEALRANAFDLVVLDIGLPDRSGREVLSEILALDPDIAILMVSGLNDAGVAAACLHEGAYDYLVKPIDLPELRQHVEQAIRRRDTIGQEADVQAWLKHELVARTREAENDRRVLERVAVGTLQVVVQMLEAKSPYFQGHSARVAALAATIGADLGLPDEEVELLRTAGRLHDIGMIGVRESVVMKSGLLSVEEQEHLRAHVTIGAQVLAPVPHLAPAVKWVSQHHERWGGGGYPDGLQGDEITLGARILCAAEVYDALTSPRPYQKTFAIPEAAERIAELGGIVLDPLVSEALSRAVEQRRTLPFLRDALDESHIDEAPA